MKNDLISRQAAIDKLETVGYDFSNSGLSEIELEEVCEAVGDVRQDMISMIKRLPSAEPETHEERTETHACDYISRQAAIDILYKNYILGRGDLNEVLDHIVDRLDKLPSAEPRKKGRWIKKTIKKKIENDYSCSECGRHVSVMRGYDVRMVYPFCHCGADMTEGEG